MNPEDQRDYESLKKLLDRLGKAVIMAVETETAEIIRRRLFDWTGLPEEAKRTADALCQLGGRSIARSSGLRCRHGPGAVLRPAIRSIPRSCPFSSASGRPCRDSRRPRGSCDSWRSGCLTPIRLGTKGAPGPAHRSGDCPIADPMFRAALFEQLGNNDLDAAVTTDIAGRKDAHRHPAGPRSHPGRSSRRGSTRKWPL